MPFAVRRACGVLALLVCLAALPARAQEPALRIENASSVTEIVPDPPRDVFSLTVVVFSGVPTTTVSLIQRYDAIRFELLKVDPVRGIISVRAGGVGWEGELGDLPLTLHMRLRVRPDAPAGPAEFPVQGRSQAGTASDSETIMVCCVTWPEAIFHGSTYMPVQLR